jgi:hypothetical protein
MVYHLSDSLFPLLDVKNNVKVTDPIEARRQFYG